MKTIQGTHWEKIRVAMLSLLCLEKNRREECNNDAPTQKKVMEKI